MNDPLVLLAHAADAWQHIAMAILVTLQLFAFKKSGLVNLSFIAG
jgi:hypothetical protein